MSEQGKQPDALADGPRAARKPGPFPWAIIVVPLLILVVVYLAMPNRKAAHLGEAVMRQKAKEYVASVLPGCDPDQVEILTVETYQNTANVTGTAMSTESSGQKRRHNWFMRWDCSSGEWKATDWKITPQ